MRRRTWHALFGAVAFACVAATVANAVRLQHAMQVNRRVAEAASDRPDRPAPERAEHDVREAREVRLARALAMASAGAHGAAFKAYGALVQPDSLDDIGQQALYNLGNLHLRQGVADAAAPAIPMIELAKQRYRDLLRVAPDDWDARYNLELALRVAPEVAPPEALQDQEPAERRRVRLRDFTPGELP